MALRLALDPTAIEAGAARGKAAIDTLPAAAFKAEAAIEAMARQGGAALLRFDTVVNNGAVSATAMGAAFAATSGQTTQFTTAIGALTAEQMRQQAATDAEIAELARLSGEFAELQARMAPAITNAERFAAVEAQVTAAVAAGVAEQREANIVLDHARAKYLALPAAVEQVGVKAVGASGGMRMLGQQLSQVAQQGAVTGNYLGALAVQLPDMALGFGSVAIAASIVATVALPMIVNAFGAGKTAAELAIEANDAYGESLSQIQTDISEATDLQDRYAAAVKSGSAATVAALQAEAGVRAALLALDQNDLAKDQAEAESRRANDLASLAAAQQELNDRKSLAATAVASGNADEIERANTELSIQQGKYDEVKTAVTRVGLELDLINAKSKGNEAAIEAAHKALDAMADGVPPIITVLDGATGAANAFGGALSVAMGYAASIQASINGISFGNIAKAAQLAALQGGASPAAATNAGTVAQATAQLRPLLDAPTGASDFARGEITNLQSGLAQSAATQAQIDAILASRTPSGGGGGGAAQIDQTRAAYDQLMASLDPVVAASKELADAQKTVNEAQAAGVITADDAAKANALAQAEFEKATASIHGAATAWDSLKSAGASALDALIDHTGSWSDALQDVIKQMGLALAKQQLLANIGGTTSGMSLGEMLIQGITGGLGGKGSFAAGGLGFFHDAGGTIGMGKTGMVGELGPELVKSTPTGAVVTSRVNTARQMQAAPAQVQVIGGDLTLTDDGKIMARMMVMARQAVDKAVETSRRAYPQWQHDLGQNGGLA